ncbi:MAG: family 2 glycosyl transferase [uncultured bacterium]|nr:MAG: family 2 glycosyl transferase [uncultured bacterium]
MVKIKLSFVILNYKTKHLLRLVLRNLQNLQLSLPHEVIVVDNASGDGSAQMVQRLYPDVRLIVSPVNTGHAKGNNLGITQAVGEYVVIMNSDIIFFDQQDIVRMVAYLDSHPEVALLGPQLRNADDTIQYSCFRPYSLFTPVYRRTPLGRLSFAQKDLAQHLMVDFDHQEVREVDWLLGAALMARKQVLDTLGAFNEQFFLYFADYELCDRIRFHGYKVVYYPDVHIVHYHRRESAQKSFWGGIGSVFNYTTRIHMKDWWIYLRINQRGYASHS